MGLAISAALSLLVYNYFADDYIKLQASTADSSRLKKLEKQANLDLSTIKDLPEKEQRKLKFEKEFAESYLSFMDNFIKFSLQYLNLFMFLYLFLYAALCKFTFWKPYNFGEHLIINSYLYGIITYVAVIFFLIGLLTQTSIFYYHFIFYPIYYLYTFKKLKDLTFWQTFLRFLKFLFLLIIILIFIGIVSLIVGIVFAKKQGILT